MNRGPAISREVTAYPPPPPPSRPPSCHSFSLSFTMPAPSRFTSFSLRRRFTLVSQLLFFDASSFLIAANRDVKTIRALLLDLEPDAQFFSRYRKPSHSRSRCRSAPLAYVSLEKSPMRSGAFDLELRVNNISKDNGSIKENFS